MISLVLFFFCTPLKSQENTKTLKSIQIENKTIKIDGHLDEKQWQQCPYAIDFIQYEPRKGKPASFKTETRILYDDDFLYIGVSCYDPQPEKVVARIAKREGPINTDDAIAIGLDTFFDRRSAYGFFTNIFGTQLDGRLSDNGRVWDETWDGEWKSAGTRTEYGWSVELVIRFSGLKFRPGQDRTWGLGIVRFIPRKLEINTWTGPVEDYGRVSQFGRLTGLSLKETKKNYQIIPHLISKFEQNQKHTNRSRH